ncbi:hypothetical protein C0995_001037 [Termitomyces sp. Mi166|nr:hypothetical protein C0995_001037 [Termitomyces sp. Mi166\
MSAEPSPTRQSRCLDDAHINRRSSLNLRQHSLLSTTTPSFASGQEWHRNPVFAPPASLLSSRRSSIVEADLEQLGRRRGRKVEVEERVPTEPASPEDGTNFRRSLQIDMKGLVGDAVGNMSISPSSRDIVLAARGGLFIIDLKAPLEIPRFLPQGGTWDVADVQWNPHPSRAEYIVSTSSEKLLIWNLLLVGKTSIDFILQAHYRAITDINWHTTECDIVISTGIDSWLWAWDLRATRKPIFGLSAFKAGGTQVKWNRQDANILASSHADEVLIWDRRKGSLPIKSIKAHSGKIYGIDWAHDRRDELVTCSLDKTIKVWDTSTDDLEPRSTIHTTYPIWRARTLPFGRGVLSLAQRGDTALEMYAAGKTDTPVERFEGHTDVVKEFVWRRGGEDEYQLITWSKDRTLRFWPVEPDVMEEVGHAVSSHRGRRPSRSGRSPSISYRNPPEGTQYLPVLSAPVGHRSILAEVRAPLPPRPVPHVGARSQGGTMSRGGPNNNSTRNPMDAITWLSIVKVGERRGSSEGGPGDSGERSRVREKFLEGQDNTSVDELVAGQLDSGVDGDDERETEKRKRSESRTRGDGEVSQSQTQSLQEEITSVLKKLHPIKVNLEKHDLTKKRTCTLGLQGPWGGTTSVFIRVTFTFPRDYPQATHPAGTPTVDIERNPLISLKDRAFMLRRLAVLREQRPCLESCLRFLLFRDNDRSGVPTLMESESSTSEDEEHVVSVGRRKSKDVPPTTLRTVKNLVEPRTSQGTFGPNGELVCFFRAPTRIVKNVLRGLSDSPATPSEEPASTPSPPADPAPAPRMFQSPSLLSDAVRRLSLSAKDRQQKGADMRRLGDRHNILRIMTNLLTLQPKPKSAQGSETSERRPLGDLLKSYALLSAPPRSTVFLGPTTNIAGGDRKVATDYVFGDAEDVGQSPEARRGGGLKEMCVKNAKFARQHGRYDHERAFRTLQAFVPSSSQTIAAFDLLAVKIIMGLYEDFSRNKDIQMLAMLSILLLQICDLAVSNSSTATPGGTTDLTTATLRRSREDYFSLNGQSPQTERPSICPRQSSTPNVPQRPGTSVPSSTSSRGSWSSLFNTGSMRQFMSGVQDSLKEGLNIPLEGATNISPTPANPPVTTRPRITLSVKLDTARSSLESIRRQPRKEQGFLSSEPKSPVSPPIAAASKSWSETGSHPLRVSPSLSSGSTGHSRRTPLAQVSDPSNAQVEVKRRIVFKPVIEAGPETRFNLFNESFLEQLRLHVRFYADLMCRWQLYHKRLELLKSVKRQIAPLDKNRKLTIGLVRTLSVGFLSRDCRKVAYSAFTLHTYLVGAALTYLFARQVADASVMILRTIHRRSLLDLARDATLEELHMDGSQFTTHADALVAVKKQVATRPTFALSGEQIHAVFDTGIEIKGMTQLVKVIR